MGNKQVGLGTCGETRQEEAGWGGGKGGGMFGVSKELLQPQDWAGQRTEHQRDSTNVLRPAERDPMPLSPSLLPSSQ